MFRNFTKQGDDPETVTHPVPPAQSPAVPASRAESVLDDLLLESVVTLSKINGLSVVQHDARISIIGELLASVLLRLHSQCGQGSSNRSASGLKI